MSYRYLKAVILDWAGTTVDFGSLAPVAALQRVFAANGVPVTAAEVREHMGMLKKDQIRAICPNQWQCICTAIRHTTCNICASRTNTDFALILRQEGDTAW